MRRQQGPQNGKKKAVHRKPAKTRKNGERKRAKRKSDNSARKTSPEKIAERLTPRQEEFCRLFTSENPEYFGIGVRAYSKAYGLKLQDKSQYDTAKANACRLLTNAYICSRIQELLDARGLTEEVADSQLLLCLMQCDDMRLKLRAVQEFNRALRGKRRQSAKTGGTEDNPFTGDEDKKLIEKLRGEISKVEE
jgi:hypothetical protein